MTLGESLPLWAQFLRLNGEGGELRLKIDPGPYDIHSFVPAFIHLGGPLSERPGLAREDRAEGPGIPDTAGTRQAMRPRVTRDVEAGCKGVDTDGGWGGHKSQRED